MDLNFKNKSVAVVGSSGNLLNREAGEEIDSHDIVIRFNQARVEGYEKYVGSRTDIRILNTHTFLGKTGNDRFPKNDPQFTTKLENQLLIVNRPVPYESIKERSPKCEVQFISDKFWHHCRSVLENKKDPSVGFLGVFLASHSSTNVNVYGFDQNNSTDKKHYWEDVRAMGTHHDFSIEKQIFKQMVEQKVISIK